MATLATFFRRSDAVRLGAASASKIQTQDPFVLRALPNDGIYFHSKRIDNSRVLRQADPAARGECWSAMGAAAVLLVLGGSIIAPNVASVTTGYKLQQLKLEKQSLLDQKRELQVQEAALMAPGRLHALAKANDMTPPSASQIYHLDGVNLDGAYAKNTPPAASPTR